VTKSSFLRKIRFFGSPTYVGKNNCEKVVDMSEFDMEWCSMECESGELYVREINCEVLGVNETEMEWSSVAFESGVNETEMDWTSMEFEGGELCIRKKRKLVRGWLYF